MKYYHLLDYHNYYVVESRNSRTLCDKYGGGTYATYMEQDKLSTGVQRIVREHIAGYSLCPVCHARLPLAKLSALEI